MKALTCKEVKFLSSYTPSFLKWKNGCYFHHEESQVKIWMKKTTACKGRYFLFLTKCDKRERLEDEDWE